MRDELAVGSLSDRTSADRVRGLRFQVDKTFAPFAFTVEGVPRPKARARCGAGGRWYTPRATKAYEEAVGWAARAAGVRDAYEGPVRLTVGLWFPDHRRRDVDNCAKSICDALNGIVYLDDSQVAELIVRRHVDPERPRAEVAVEYAETEALWDLEDGVDGKQAR